MPRFAFIDLVNIANPLVGRGPKVVMCMPTEAKPATNAGSNI